MLGTVASVVEHFVVSIVVVVIVIVVVAVAIVKVCPAMLETTSRMSTTASARCVTRRMKTSRTDATRSCASITSARRRCASGHKRRGSSSCHKG